MISLYYAIEILQTELLKKKEYMRTIRRAEAEIQGSIWSKDDWAVEDDQARQLEASIGVLRSYEKAHLRINEQGDQ